MHRLSLRITYVLCLSLSLGLTGCGKLKRLLGIKDNGGTLKCTLSLANPAVLIPAGTSQIITVSIDGGTSPFVYDITGPVVVSDPSFSINYTFTNKQSYATTQDIVFKLSDSGGNQAMCELTATVGGNGDTGGGGTNPNATPTPTPTPNPVTCQLNVLDISPEVNRNVNLIATGTAGTPAFTFSNLTLTGAGASIVNPLSVLNEAQASAKVKFSTPGTKSATVTATDANGRSNTCSTNITVRQPAVTVTANPANGSTPTGGSITLTANITGFASNSAAYAFTTNEPGVNIAVLGKVATVTATDGGAHSFSVTVTATDAAMADVATTSIGLSFTSVYVPLSCTVNVAARSGSLYPVIPYTYYYYSVSPDVPAAAGATGVKITSIQTSAYGYNAYARDDRTQNVTFINASPLVAAQVNVRISIFISDAQGRGASCSTTATVWAY